MDSYTEVRRVRSEMSAAAGHDIRTLIANINKLRPAVAAQVIDPGTEAERTHSEAIPSAGDGSGGR